MLVILFRNICSRSARNILLIAWFAAEIAIIPENITDCEAGAFIAFGVQILMLILICVISGGVWLPHTMFILPLSREDRKNYVRKLRNLVFSLSALLCAAAGIFLIICGRGTVLSAACMCITGMSIAYVMSFVNYFMTKESGMIGVLMLFCLLHIGLMHGANFYDRFNIEKYGIWIMAVCVLAAVIEVIVLHRYTEDMVNRLSDYEASVNMEKKLGKEAL